MSTSTPNEVPGDWFDLLEGGVPADPTEKPKDDSHGEGEFSPTTTLTDQLGALVRNQVPKDILSK